MQTSNLEQARREPQRGPGKHDRRAQSPPPRRSVCLEIETPKVSRGRKRGKMCPLTIRIGVRGSVVITPPAGSGAEPRPKMDFMHTYLGQNEAAWNTIFSIFERRRGPQTSRGPGKLSPLSPLSTGLRGRHFLPEKYV